MSVPSLGEIKSVFKLIGGTKSAQHLVNEKLSPEQRKLLHTMDEFFRIINSDRFDGIAQIQYKNTDGYDYYLSNLKKLLASSMSSESKASISALFDDIYNCFTYLFPDNTYKYELEEAQKASEKSSITSKESNPISASDLNSLFALANSLKGLGKDEQYGEIATLLLRIIKNKKTLTETLDEVSYISQKAKDVEQKLQRAEEKFDSQSKLLFDELKSNNENYRKKLEEKLNEDISVLDIRIKKNKDDYKDTVDEFNIRIKKLDARFKALEIGTYREELARYFLREHDKLKGKIDSLAALYFIFLNAGVAVTTYLVTSFGCKLETVNAVLLGFVAVIVCSFIIFHCDSKKINARVFKSMSGLLTPYWCWLFLTFLGMSSILYKAISVSSDIKPEQINGSDVFGLILPHIGAYIILVWFTWFSAKQFSYTKQIADEYEYKYALAKAYMSYKDEALSVVIEQGNNPYLVALLDSVIKNIASSPVQSVKQDVHTPFSEVCKVAKDALDKNNMDDLK